MLVTHLVINSVSFLPWDFLMLFWVTININIAQVRHVKLQVQQGFLTPIYIPNLLLKPCD